MTVVSLFITERRGIKLTKRRKQTGGMKAVVDTLTGNRFLVPTRQLRSGKAWGDEVTPAVASGVGGRTQRLLHQYCESLSVSPDSPRCSEGEIATGTCQEERRHETKFASRCEGQIRSAGFLWRTQWLWCSALGRVDTRQHKRFVVQE